MHSALQQISNRAFAGSFVFMLYLVQRVLNGSGPLLMVRRLSVRPHFGHGFSETNLPFP